MSLQITPLQMQKFSHGSGFNAAGIRAPDAVLDPFLMIDHYRMSQATFGPHPHAGVSAVTYMFDDAETGFINHDSLGAASQIAPGDAHWSIAGSGIVHDEVPEQPGQTAHGLQLFVNLSIATELQPARALHFSNAEMPRFRQVSPNRRHGGHASGALIKLAFGRYRYLDVSHQLGDLPTDVTLLDVQLESTAEQLHYYLESATGIVIPIQGEVLLAGELIASPIAIRGSDLLSLGTPDRAQFVLLLGERLAEPVFRHGPFALSSAERLRDAISRYQNNEFGSIQPGLPL
jgi:redox-sensitive bicupin YhaK (pirin superfamily)